jgi:hypothetical protein
LARRSRASARFGTSCGPAARQRRPVWHLADVQVEHQAHQKFVTSHNKREINGGCTWKNMGTVAPDGPHGSWLVHTGQRERRELFMFCVCWLHQTPTLAFGMLTKPHQSQKMRGLNHIFFWCCKIRFCQKVVENKVISIV